ncbi:MAG TPA: UbiD family decarboxylase [Chloroflexota bacterium]|nr:UbiD family decarboxylase [Chloroflexota bacterium]
MTVTEEVRAPAPSLWRDTREWLDRVAAIGELRVVRGASWQEDIGAITEMLDHTENSPAVIFDDVPGHASGWRVLVNANGTPPRQAITLGLPLDQATHGGLMAYWRGVLSDLRSIPPREVSDGPIFENVLEGDAVDLEAFPTPIWHPKDGGRFIGTASLNVLRDPDSSWVNIASYRNQVFSKDSLGIWISPGKHGRYIRQKYFDRKQPCPIVVVVGADPLLFMAACAEGIAFGQSELDWVGGVRGAPIDVVRGRHTGLPIPATSEIAIEGWIDPDERHLEGPYGEWMGYYASGAPMTPVIRVSAIYHRDQPILLGCPQGKPPHEDNRFLAYIRSAIAEDQIRRAGVPGVVGVWCPPETGNRLMTIVAIEQQYAGHARQAGLMASQCGAAAYAGRFVVVVDEDIDIYDLNDVFWAMTTRCDPIRDVRTIDRAWSGPLDPAIHPDERGYNSRLIVDATRPWEWRDRFAEPVITPEMARATREKWGWIVEKPSAAS